MKTSMDITKIICSLLNISKDDIKNIDILKKGMTNNSFTFEYNQKKYIIRIPGEGTDNLINRTEEAEVYSVINNNDICENIIYINPTTGIKISEFIEDAKCCDAYNWDDVTRCLDKLKKFHIMNFKVNHYFDIFEKIEFYESLWNSNPSQYNDYLEIKTKVLALKKYIDSQDKENCLCHIDSVSDNFVFDKENKIYLIDWEYAGMQDPHVDIAMFCIYALYEKKEIDKVIDIYFNNDCPNNIRLKIYCYISACGLLWSNWCEYKRNLGIEFGDYALKQYQYAKDYYEIVKTEIGDFIYESN